MNIGFFAVGAFWLAWGTTFCGFVVLPRALARRGYGLAPAPPSQAPAPAAASAEGQQAPQQRRPWVVVRVFRFWVGALGSYGARGRAWRVSSGYIVYLALGAPTHPQPPNPPAPAHKHTHRSFPSPPVSSSTTHACSRFFSSKPDVFPPNAGPWFAGNFLSGSPPGFLFCTGILFHNPQLGGEGGGEWEYRQMLDAIMVSGPHLAFTVR